MVDLSKSDPHAYDNVRDVHKGDRISAHNVKENARLKQLDAERRERIRIAEERERIAKKERGIANRLKGFFVGTTIAGKPHGFALLRKDLNPFKRRGRR